MSAQIFRKASAVFGPAEIANLTEAYSVALASIDEASVRPDVPAHRLRRELASRLIEEAAHGPLEPRLLAERALARLGS